MNATVAAWGKLLRVSLAPTAVGDVLAGSVLATGGLRAPGAVLTLVAASLCVYHGGMALNDWADRVEDAEFGRERAARPRRSWRSSPCATRRTAAASRAAARGPRGRTTRTR